MLVVDPCHWLSKEGEFLRDEPRLYRRMLRIARFIEYGGPLAKGTTRETLVECNRRPRGKPCLGLMWVSKTKDDSILARCMVCKTDEASPQLATHGVADGMMDPSRSTSTSSRAVVHCLLGLPLAKKHPTSDEERKFHDRLTPIDARSLRICDTDSSLLAPFS